VTFVHCFGHGLRVCHHQQRARSRGLRQLHNACSCLPVVAESAAGCRNGIILKRPAKAKRNLLFTFITAYTHDERFERKQWRFIATQTHACAL